MPVTPTLFFEFHGTSERASTSRRATVEAIAREHGGLGFEWATTPEARASCGRRATTRTTRRSPRGPARGRWTTDVCVPISRLAECILETQA